MNRTLTRAFGAALLACGGVVTTFAQAPILDPSTCTDFTAKPPFYTTNYNYLFSNTAAFGAGIGYNGTTLHYFAPPSICAGGAVPVAGRIGFAMGPTGSIQDDQRPDLYGGVRDNAMALTYGEGTQSGTFYNLDGYVPSSGGLSFARVYVNITNGTAVTSTNYLYGAGGLDDGYFPAAGNGRYIVTSDTLATGLRARCVIEVLADAARVNWTLYNNLATNADMGLYFGQIVAIRQDGPRVVYEGAPAGSEGLKTYITAPGLTPAQLTLQARYTGANVPAYVNFSASQTAGWGLQILNSPQALDSIAPNASADQTPVDEFTLGLPGTGGVIDGGAGDTNPLQNDGIQGGSLAASLNPLPVYLQKWLPTTVLGGGGTRDITSYYRATSFDSNYAPLLTGYVVSVDTPKTVSTTQNTAGAVSFDPNPMTIRVTVDNTGSFSTDPDRFVNMQNVAVTLSLPNGMHAVNDPANRVLTKTISGTIKPGNTAFADFQVAVDPTVSGAQTYTVSVTPRPGTFFTKTVTGTINVATTARLLVRSGPNLVSPPWEFDQNDWSAVLSDTVNGGFQAYTWDAELQKYVTQANPERRRGTWIVSTTDRGNLVLGGTPQTPGDQLPDPTDFRVGTGASIKLYPGWNLVGNPYTYAFQLNGLRGILTGGRVLTYAELVAGQYTNGAFTSYDQDLKSYRNAIQGPNARLQPNLGYWIYSNVEMDLQFPPLYDLFIRSAEPGAQPQRWNNWRLQLSAANAGTVDAQNFVGTVRNPADTLAMNTRKAPRAPVASARGLYSYVAGLGNVGMSQMMRASTGQQKFDYTVESTASGPVTVSWPNLKEIPSNLDVQVTDTVTGKTVNARSVVGYTYTAGTASSRKFAVTVTPLSTVAQRVNTLAATAVTMGSTRQLKIDYSVTGRGAATITVLKGNAVVSTVLADADIAAGANSTYWAMVDSNGHLLPNGTYTLQVVATGESGKTATRQATIVIKR